MSSAAVVIGALKVNCQYFSQLTIHGKNMTSVYKKMDQSVLPREYLPDDYAGPSAGSVKQIVGKIIFNISAIERQTCSKLLPLSKLLLFSYQVPFSCTPDKDIRVF